jgi:UrcA family protein
MLPKPSGKELLEAEMKKTLLALSLFTALVLPGRASAEDGSTVSSVRISYSDLDLRTSTGQRTLRRRLDAAVAKLCPHGRGVGIAELTGRRNCLGDTSAEARRQERLVIARVARNAVDSDALAVR